MDNKNSQNPIRILEKIKQDYLKYYDDAFGLANKKLQKERRDLLSNNFSIYSSFVCWLHIFRRSSNI